MFCIFIVNSVTIYHDLRRNSRSDVIFEFFKLLFIKSKSEYEKTGNIDHINLKVIIFHFRIYFGYRQLCHYIEQFYVFLEFVNMMIPFDIQ